MSLPVELLIAWIMFGVAFCAGAWWHSLHCTCHDVVGEDELPMD